jgi:ubiquitin-protein ligase
MSIELLDRLPNTYIKKRIINELKKIDINSFLEISAEIHELPTIIIKMVDNLYKTNNVYSFRINNGYPFNKPTVFINNNPYIDFLKIRSVDTSVKLKLLKGYDCFCCNSLVICANRWRPESRLINIVEEIRQFREDRKCIMYKIILDKIKQKYLNIDIVLDSWLF